MGWICPRWGGFAGVGHRWVGFACVGLAHVGPARVDPPSLGGIRSRWSSLGGFVTIGWNRWRWSSLGWIHPLWSSWFPTPLPPCVPLLHHTVSPSLPGSFLPLSLSSFFPSPDRGWITKTDHDKRRGSCFITHSWGLPLHGSPASSSLPRSSVERDLAAHIPLKRGGTASAASSLVREPKRC